MGSRRALTSTIHRDQPSRLLQLENELLNIVLQQLSARDLSCVSSASRELEEPAKYVLVQRALMDWTDPADALLRSARYMAWAASRRAEAWAPVATGGLEASFFVDREGMLMESPDKNTFVCVPFEAMRGIRVRNVVFRGGMWAAVSRAGDCVYTCTIDTFASSVPPVVTAFVANRVVSVSAGSVHCLCVGEGGEMFSWGNDEHGQCGHGYIGSVYSAPRWVESMLGVLVRSASAGDVHSLVVTEDGDLYSFGGGAAGQLGHGTVDGSVENYSSEYFPRKVRVVASPGALRCIAAAAGNLHSLALTADGRVFAWGDNAYGQLGLSEFVQRSDFPQCVMGWWGWSGAQLGKVCSVSAGWETSFAITDTGALFHWGADGVEEDVRIGGEFRDIRHCVYTPSVVYAFSEKFVVAVSSSYAHTIAVTSDGHVHGCPGSVHAGVGAWGAYDGLLL